MNAVEVFARPLDLAGYRLDAAAAELSRLCRPSAPLPDEHQFGRAEQALELARTEYRRLLSECVGQDADTIESRLGA